MDSIEQAVIARNQERRDALIANDVVRVRKTMADDLIFIHTTGKVETREEFLERLSSGALRYNAIFESNQRVQRVGGLVVLLSDLAQQLTLAGQERVIHSVSLSVWIKERSGWMMQTYQATACAAPIQRATAPLRGGEAVIAPAPVALQWP
ncbi:MAG: nuclear transport factor 2 family protein [Pseudomonadota bacterium]